MCPEGLNSDLQQFWDRYSAKCSVKCYLLSNNFYYYYKDSKPFFSFLWYIFLPTVYSIRIIQFIHFRLPLNQPLLIQTLQPWKRIWKYWSIFRVFKKTTMYCNPVIRFNFKKHYGWTINTSIKSLMFYKKVKHVWNWHKIS